MSNLDSFLEDLGSDTSSEAQATDAQATEATNEQAQNTSSTESQVDTKAETTTAKKEESEPAQVPIAALKDERRKRQEAELKLKEFQASQQNSRQQEQEQAPDFYEDPDKRLEYERQQIQRERIKDRVTMSEMLVRDKYEDYDKTLDVFDDMCKENPSLVTQMVNAQNPALFAYQQAKKYQQLKDIQDPDAYREKLKAEVRAELEAEFKEKQQKAEDERKKLGVSLTDARSTGAKNDSSNDEDEDGDAFTGLFDSTTKRIKR